MHRCADPDHVPSDSHILTFTPGVRSKISNPELQVYVAVDPLKRLLVVITIPFVGLDKGEHWPASKVY